MTERQTPESLQQPGIVVLFGSGETSASGQKAFDWLFRHDKLVKSGQTSFELIYTSDLMTVRYYALVTEDDIQLNDGS